METRREWNLTELAGLYKKAIGIAVERNKKYASEEDPYKNFRESARFAGITVEQGILVRLGDKFARLKNTIDRGENDDVYSDESFDDCVVDIQNYIGLLRNYRLVARQEREEADKQLRLFAEEPEEEVTQAEDVPADEKGFTSRIRRAVGILVD